MSARAILVVAVFALWAGPAAALDPEERLEDPALEARARAISRDVRCLVCQNESIDASNAELAKDLRILVRERIAAGDSDAEVRDFLVARYGDYVLMTPPLRASTWALWAGPFLLLAAAVVALLMARGRGGAAEPVAALSPEERRRLDELGGGETGPADGRTGD